VELGLHISDDSRDFWSNITLKRSIKEVWVKKRGSEESVFKNNTVEYFFNGESQTKGDYEKYIAKLIDERVFRAITNPTYFPSLKWQDQRNFLTAMIGSIEPECFADTDDLKSLVDYFDQHDEDLESYLKHLKYQIKQIKDKLDKIPVRLEEQNKALPERLDWDNINGDMLVKKHQLEEVEKDILAIKQGDGSDVKRSEIRNQISTTTVATDKLRMEAREKTDKLAQERTKRVSDASLKFNEALNNQKLMEQTIEADRRLVERCEQSINECDEELERLRLAWPNRKFEVKEGDNICPTCGQYLSPDMFANKVAAMRMKFNEALEAEKQSLRDKAAKVKKDKEDAEKELENTRAKLLMDNQSLLSIKENINTIFADKAKIEKETVPTIDELLAVNVQYVALSKQLAELKAALDSVNDSEDNREKVAELESNKAQFEAEIANYQQQLATRLQYDRILALIDGINEEQKDLVRQLSELEKKEDIARQYQFRQNQLLEERINQHFKLVQWRLFKTVNNGGDSFEEPFCECYVGGIPYHAGLNQAMRLNAGLDICEALCKFYNVSAPIVIDNAESNLNIYPTTGQQIRLQVYESDLILV
jgi:hypothetical protein